MTINCSSLWRRGNKNNENNNINNYILDLILEYNFSHYISGIGYKKMKVLLIIWGTTLTMLVWFTIWRLSEIEREVKWHGTFLDDNDPAVTIDKLLTKATKKGKK